MKDQLLWASLITTEGVDAAFVCTFVCYGWPHRSDPREDLDMASWGVVKLLEGRSGDTYSDVPWETQGRLHCPRRLLPRLKRRGSVCL